MPYRTAVCDDDPAAADFVSHILREWASLRQLPILVEQFSSAEGFLPANSVMKSQYSIRAL